MHWIIRLRTKPFIQRNNNVMGFNKSYLVDLATLDGSCGYAAFREQYMPSSLPASNHPNISIPLAMPNVMSGVWATPTPAPEPLFQRLRNRHAMPAPLGYPTDLQYAYPGLPIYFNRTDAKQAIHAPMDVERLECKGPVFVGESGPEDEGDSSADQIQHALPKVMEKTNRVLVANGALDFEIITSGTLLAIQNMTWNGALSFQARPSKNIVLTLPDLQYQNLFAEQGFGDTDNSQGVMGVQHYERGLVWAEMFLSGHMQS